MLFSCSSKRFVNNSSLSTVVIYLFIQGIINNRCPGAIVGNLFNGRLWKRGVHAHFWNTYLSKLGFINSCPGAIVDKLLIKFMKRCTCTTVVTCLFTIVYFLRWILLKVFKSIPDKPRSTSSSAVGANHMCNGSSPIIPQWTPQKRHSFFEWTTGVKALLTFTCSLEGLWTTGVHALLWVLIFKVVYLSLSPTTSCFLWVLRPRIFPSFFVRCRVEVPTFLVSFCFCSVSRASIF